ncbi:MAG: GntR family transcriptional regulator [bacterium]|nr:GntR family transcriptional regulator [Candidatus Sumerlaeota bacterium]
MTINDWDIVINRHLDEPLHVQITKAIRAKIESGEWKPGHQLPSYNELVKLTKVSMITIQQSVGSLIKEGTLSRKRGIGVFVPDGHQSHKERIIGLLLPDVRHQFFSGLAHVIQTHANRQGYAITMYSLEADPSRAYHVVDLALRQNVAGIITSPTISEHFSFQFSGVLKRRIPIVFVDGKSSHEGFDYVETNNRLGMELVLDHLTSLGHKRIGFACCQILTQGVRERMQAFQELLAERGLDFSPPLLQVSHLPDDDGGENAGYTLLSLREPPTAIVCSNDLAAVGVMRAARKLDVECPGELSVVGFDDLELSSHLEIPLTTVRQPVNDIGQTAVDLLLARLHGTGTAERETRSLAPELIIRSSTAACRSALSHADSVASQALILP